MMWGRLYSDTRNKREVVALSRLHPTHWRVIYTLLEIAFDTWDGGPVGGDILAAPGIPYTLADLSAELKLSHKKLLPVLRSMAELSIVNLRIEYENPGRQNPKNMLVFLKFLEWKQYQSDSSTSRTQKYRSKSKESNTYAASGTAKKWPPERSENGEGNGPDTEPEVETYSDSDTDIDLEINPFPFSEPKKGSNGESLRPRDKGTNPRSKGTNPRVTGTNPRANGKTSLPPAFGISEAVRKWAEARGFSRLDEHLEAFKDYAQSNNKQYADWDAAFRSAIRGNWGKIGVGQPPPTSGPPARKKHDPACSRCKGRGVYKVGDGLMTTCDCEGK